MLFLFVSWSLVGLPLGRAVCSSYMSSFKITLFGLNLYHLELMKEVKNLALRARNERVCPLSLFSTLKCLVGKTSDKGLVYPLNRNHEQEHQRATGVFTNESI